MDSKAKRRKKDFVENITQAATENQSHPHPNNFNRRGKKTTLQPKMGDLLLKNPAGDNSSLSSNKLLPKSKELLPHSANLPARFPNNLWQQFASKTNTTNTEIIELSDSCD